MTITNAADFAPLPTTRNGWLQSFMDEVAGSPASVAARADMIRVDPNFGYTVRSFESYQNEMAECIARELQNAGAERRSVDFYNALEDKDELALEIMLAEVGMSREEQSAALDALGQIAETMLMIDKYDIVLIYRAIASALPIALTILKEIKTKVHQSAPTPTMKQRGAPVVGARRAEIKATMTVAAYLSRSKKRCRIQ